MKKIKDFLIKWHVDEILIVLFLLFIFLYASIKYGW
jgi:hypothetical protein